MEVDPPLLNTTHDSPLHSQVTQHPSPENFQLNTEQIKTILAFGKDLQRLYNTVTTGQPNDKFKVLLQVAYRDAKVDSSSLLPLFPGLFQFVSIHRPSEQSSQLLTRPSSTRTSVCCSKLCYPWYFQD